MFIALVSGNDILVLRADFPNGVYNDATIGDPVTLGTGNSPDVAAFRDHVEVAFENSGYVYVASSAVGGLTFATP